MTTRAPTVVELAGLPGAGKTTGIPRLQEALSSRGVQSRSAVRLREPSPSTSPGSALARSIRALWFGWHRARSVLRYWKAAFVALRALARSSRPRSEKGPAFRRFAITLDNYETARHLSPTSARAVVIIDEGVVQNAFALFVNPVYDPVPRNRELATYIARSPVPDLLVYLRTDPTECIDRLKSRHPIGVAERFDHLDQTALERTLAGGALTLETVIDGMRRRGCAVLEVSGEVPSPPSPTWEEIAEQVVAVVEERPTIARAPSTRS